MIIINLRDGAVGKVKSLPKLCTNVGPIHLVDVEKFLRLHENRLVALQKQSEDH